MRPLARSLAVFALLTTAMRPAAAQPLALAKSDYPSAPGARTIVSADFNRDGWPDVAHAGLGTSAVSILLNDHGHGLISAGDVPAGAGAFDMTVGDFNRDGIPDLAVANADSNSISILLGRGDGRFNGTGIGTGPSPRGITTGDFNEDGKPDLAYTAYASDTVEVLIGDGYGRFARGWSFGAARQPQGIAAADFNRDGHLDLVAAHDGAQGLVVWHAGDGGYLPTAVPGDAYLNVVATADVNGDGWTDVVAASTARSRTAIYLGSASGLRYTQSYAVASDPRGLTIADVNIDGVPDVITANRATSTVSVLLGDPAHRGGFLPQRTFEAGTNSRAIAAADVNGDGRIDLVTGNQYAAAVSVLTNITVLPRAGYVFANSTIPAGAELASVPAASGHGLAVADFNRDGKLDVVQRIGGADDVAVVLRDGGTVTLPGAGPYGGHVVADVNADGNADLAAFSPDRIVTHLGTGRGTFRSSPVSDLAGLSLAACVAGDMNRDRLPDLVCVETYGGRLHVLASQGDGTFHVAFATDATVSDPQVADLNRDGRLDVVLASGEIWLGDGTGRLIPSATVEDAHGSRVRVADLDRDGYLDLVFSVFASDERGVIVALGGPSGYRVESPVHWFSFESYFDCVIADLNADGNPDVLVNPLTEAYGAGVMWVMPGRGDGTFGTDEPFALLPPGEILVVDMTRDGLLDVATPAGRAIRVLTSRRTNNNRAPVVTTHDLTIEFTGETLWPMLQAEAIDPDQHGLWFEWRDRRDAWVGGGSGTFFTAGQPMINAPGRYEYQLAVSDSRGAVVTRTVVVTVLGPREIVLHMNQAIAHGSDWTVVNDSNAASGVRAYNPNRGVPKVTAPSANPASYVERYFLAEPTRVYKLWIRLKADGDYWGNDSVWVQFSGSTDTAGSPAYRVGTTSGLAVNLEECANCGESGWGWEDDGWGAVNRNGVLLRFPQSGWQRIVIQTREDGVSIDQVVLSAEEYVSTRPGAARNDRTILNGTQ